MNADGLCYSTGFFLTPIVQMHNDACVYDIYRPKHNDTLRLNF